ncbi:carbohydrate kinase [Streptomyces sp. NPDC050516]|uniref:carbohydrate kinase n=1 Tax=Streptomyces sp. NPDC050516 TaxID=3365621 RepID=UPI0037955FAA
MTAGAPPLLVIGEALTDVIVKPTGARRSRPGGSPANVALGLARLGHPVRLATRIGHDAPGQQISDHLRGAGVELTAGSVTAAPTSSAVARLDAQGSATYDFDLSWDPDPRALDPVTPGLPSHLHTGSLATSLAPGASLAVAAVEKLRGTATVSYDPNPRPALLSAPERERPRVERMVMLSDVVKASAEDLRWLHPGGDPFQAAARWARMGPSLVVVTLGEEGARAFWRHGDCRLPPRRIDRVVDTVGAGDAFMAGLLSGLLRTGLLASGGGGVADAEGARRALHAATLSSHLVEHLAAALSFAARVAAVTCTRQGADPPTLTELERSGRDA